MRQEEKRRADEKRRTNMMKKGNKRKGKGVDVRRNKIK